MYRKLSFRFSVVLALAALLMNVFAAWAYPAEPPVTSPDARSIIKTPCYQVIDTAEEVFAGMDIPARRADYAALDRISDCIRVASVSTSVAPGTVPATGRAAWTTSQYLEMKDRQAERMNP